jgi:phage terminase large subunit-like protein
MSQIRLTNFLMTFGERGHAAQLDRQQHAALVTKQASGSPKIDPLMAAFNAIALMSTNP